MNNELLAQLEKLAELKDKGIITDYEFNEKKRVLLNNLNSSIKKERIDEKNTATYWLPIPSFILSMFALLCTFDIENWTHDEKMGCGVFIVISLALGIVSISIQEKGKGLAIAAICISIFSALIVIGS